MGLGPGTGRGGWRPGAGRPRKHPLPGAAADPRVLAGLDRIYTLLQAQEGALASLRQQRRDESEHGPMILRRLTEIERVVRGDPGLAKVPRSTRRRPLGAD
jgi:hypothetical protein